MKETILFFTAIILSGCFSSSMLDTLDLPDDTLQVILITTQSWDSPAGILQLFEKSQSHWHKIDEDIPVTMGRNGLGWGAGVHVKPTSGHEKVEGDGRAPAGIFKIGTAYGYAPEPLAGLKLSYKQATERDYFVDDPDSEDYNQWVTIDENEPNEPKQKWASFEHMRRDDHRYELGFVVQHNMSPVISGKGSAIFFHVWWDAETPTAGCTAMQKSDLEKVLGWLDPGKKPLVVQVPKNDFSKLKLSN